MTSGSIYTDELAAAICERIADGETLRSICSDEGMPSKSTVMRWLGSKPDFADQMTKARQLQAESFADDLIEIADNARNDWMERHGDQDAGWVANGEHIQRSRLRLDARRWLMSKTAPKKYGDKLDLNHSGEIRSVPIDFSGMPHERRVLLLSLLEEAQATPAVGSNPFRRHEPGSTCMRLSSRS